MKEKRKIIEKEEMMKVYKGGRGKELNGECINGKWM